MEIDLTWTIHVILPMCQVDITGIAVTSVIHYATSTYTANKQLVLTAMATVLSTMIR